MRKIGIVDLDTPDPEALLVGCCDGPQPWKQVRINGKFYVIAMQNGAQGIAHYIYGPMGFCRYCGKPLDEATPLTPWKWGLDVEFDAAIRFKAKAMLGEGPKPAFKGKLETCGRCRKQFTVGISHACRVEEVALSAVHAESEDKAQ